MSTTHTPDFGEPWTLETLTSQLFNDDYESVSLLRTSAGRIIADHVVSDDTDDHYMRRACDAVNVLAGISDPAAALQQLRNLLNTIYDNTEGYADGAPDASPHDKLCNEVSSLAKQAIALLTPNK